MESGLGKRLEYAQGSYYLVIRKCKWISLCLGEQASDFSERFSYLQSSFQAAFIS